ncbi:MAG: hypothetical protein E3J35_11555 [Methanomassiliicoccales archaeon]|nr:MAG: hypothetical protein E3J35_11555 [Methanomassiliicoccales archaeon]
MQKEGGSEKDEVDVFGMAPAFYRFEIINVVTLLVIGIILIVLTAIDILHVYLGVGLLAIVAGISSTASWAFYNKARSSGPLQGELKKSFKYRLVTGFICFVAGAALLIAYAMDVGLF